ncbi:hypothetical protein NE237_021145 [Protea cynaroides]|uniref:Wall-associated receptor kinase C-terminal domain-containing protein n=1 Tax=Protea cynaroides TaxID=273540 RepID=A0A9Q0K436_9MAGN|nr:hypothetical protein NE237_021145 [Protea cynaroides]
MALSSSISSFFLPWFQPKPAKKTYPPIAMAVVTLDSKTVKPEWETEWCHGLDLCNHSLGPEGSSGSAGPGPSLFSRFCRSDGADGANNTAYSLCDNNLDATICSLLYSCPDISSLNLPLTSTCCVYTPMDLGLSFEIDLQKLQCNSYTAIYSFNGQESNPESWKYGVGLKSKFNVNNEYPRDCSDCERSNGVCGYKGPYNSFICSWIGGLITNTDCYFAANLSDSVRLLSSLMGKPHF